MVGSPIILTHYRTCLRRCSRMVGSGSPLVGGSHYLVGVVSVTHPLSRPRSRSNSRASGQYLYRFLGCGSSQQAVSPTPTRANEERIVSCRTTEQGQKNLQGEECSPPLPNPRAIPAVIKALFRTSVEPISATSRCPNSCLASDQSAVGSGNPPLRFLADLWPEKSLSTPFASGNRVAFGIDLAWVL